MEKEVEKQIDDLVGTFTDPIIVYPGGWEDTLPETIKADIKTHRLIQLMKGEDGLATWPEVCAYMYTVTLCFPPRSEWVNIYMHAMTQYKGDATPDDIRHDKLSDYEMKQLLEFRRWIWERRVQARKGRQRAEKRQAREDAEARAPKQMEIPGLVEAEYDLVRSEKQGEG